MNAVSHLGKLIISYFSLELHLSRKFGLQYGIALLSIFYNEIHFYILINIGFYLCNSHIKVAVQIVVVIGWDSFGFFTPELESNINITKY